MLLDQAIKRSGKVDWRQAMELNAEHMAAITTLEQDLICCGHHSLKIKTGKYFKLIKLIIFIIVLISEN